MTAPSDFDSLVRETRPQLVRFLARMVGNADAEDVTQATLAKASAAFSSFRGRASPRTWLFRIAANAARDWLRSHRQLEATGALVQDGRWPRTLGKISQAANEPCHRLAPEETAPIAKLEAQRIPAISSAAGATFA